MSDIPSDGSILWCDWPECKERAFTTAEGFSVCKRHWESWPSRNKNAEAPEPLVDDPEDERNVELF